MMTTEHPIMPSPELVEEWANASAQAYRENGTYVQHEFAIATQAARWGSDQELEACCKWLRANVGRWEISEELRDARRPKQLSLKQLCLMHLSVMERDGHYIPEILEDLRRALKKLND